MEIEEIIRLFVEFINSGNMEIGKRIIDPEVIFYAPTSTKPMRGLEGYVQVLNMMRAAMPDVHWTVEETITEGNKILVRFTMSGTQTGPLMNMPASGKSVKVIAMNIYEIQNEKIIREHGLPDLFSLMNQIKQ